MKHASGPQHAHNVSLFRIAKPDHDVGGVLSQISVRPGNFKFLAIASSEHFHLGSDGAFVVGQPPEREPQPVILIATFIAQQHGRPMILCDEQISRAVAIVIASNDGAWLFELNLIETNVGSDVFETISAEIAEQAHLAFAFFRFADGDQIDPAVVVVVEGGDTVGADPVGLGQFYPIETLTMIVSPECDSGRSQVREGQVHPPIVVEIQRGYSRRFWETKRCPGS